MEENNFSILMLPYLAHGHMYPFFELAKRLTKRNFKIFICSSAISLDSIKKEVETTPSIELVELEVPSSPELPPHMHTTKNLPTHLMPNLFQALEDSSASFAHILDAKNPDMVIYDFAPSWGPKLATSRGIPAVFFGIVGSTTYAYNYHHHPTTKDRRSSTFPSEAVRLLDHEKYYTTEEGDPLWDILYGNLALSSEVVLMKSCRAVEEVYGDYLSTLCKKEVITAGPLIGDYGSVISKADDEGILEWLGGKDRRSTLYISFGSEHFLTEGEIREIAKALEMCDGVNFIWVIRFSPGHNNDAAPSSLDQVLPQTFLGNTKERGRIITGWAPQQKILAHPSIGGFLSHCGTNSITEALIFGVPIIAMPIKYEQPLTARMLVAAGCATEVVAKPSGEASWILNYYVGEEIAKGINRLFVEKESGEGMRRRAMELGQKIKESEEDEVSYAAEQLLKLCIKYKQSRFG